MRLLPVAREGRPEEWQMLADERLVNREGFFVMLEDDFGSELRAHAFFAWEVYASDAF